MASKMKVSGDIGKQRAGECEKAFPRKIKKAGASTLTAKRRL
mgnify:CR=1 FL=1